MHSIRSAFQITTGWCTCCHDTMYKHCALAGTTICANFIVQALSTRLLPIHVKLGAKYFFVMPDFPPSFSVFHYYCQHSLKCILLFLQFEIFSALLYALQGIPSSKLLSSMYQFYEFLNRSAKSLDTQALPRA